MRLQILGDLAGTGFGTVTMDLGRAMLANGDDLRFVSLNETPGALPEPFGSRTLRIGAADGWIHAPADPSEAIVMRDRILGLFSGDVWQDGWRPDAVLIIGDLASVREGVMPEAIASARVPMWNYVPIEGVGLPPRWGEFWAKVRPIAMSEFGAGEIEKVTGERPPVVYHGVDTEAFYRASREHPITVRSEKDLAVLRSRDECKRFLGLPTDKVIIYRADRNMPRKRYGSLMRAVAPVLAARPEALLLWHCRTVDQGGDLLDERSKYPPEIAERMRSTGFHDQWGGVDRTILNILYNAADIYASVSAEGFGLTIAEAIACGTPAVGIDYSSVPEVIGPAGVVVSIAGLVENTYSHWWAGVDEALFARALDHLVTHRTKRLSLGAMGPGHVARRFSWADAASRFRDIMAVPVEVAA